MKICFCIGTLESGGAERVVSILANEFSKLGDDVSIVLVSSKNDSSFYNICKDITIIPLLKETKKAKGIFSKIKLLKKVILTIKPDVVISFLTHIDFYTFFALKNTGIIHIASERNNPKSLPKQKIFRAFRNYVYSKIDGVVVQTDDAYKYFEKKAKALTKIINPVADEIIELRHEPVSIRKNRIIFVGSDKKEKNRQMAYLSFSLFLKENPGYEMWVFGSPINENDHKTIQELNISNNIIYKGKDPFWHKQCLDSKMYILTSDFEGMPNSLLEAAIIGLPCISTDCPIGGSREILDYGKRGMLVSCNDSVGFANAMAKVANDDKLSTAFNDKSKELVSLCSANRIAKEWKDFVQLIASKNRNKTYLK